MNPESNDKATEGALLQSMVVLSTLSTAAEVWHAAEERRAGRDPSAQEEEGVARAYLATAKQELQERVMRLRASLVYAQHRSEERLPALVRRFDDLMTLNHVARLLHIMHQRLLSLYPVVSESLVEEARLLEKQCSEVAEIEDGAFLEALGPFLERALVFTAGLQQELFREN